MSIRNTFSRMGVLLAAVTIVALGWWTGDAQAGKKYLGTYSVGQVYSDCIAAGGDATTGRGRGGYGCVTDVGEVSCNAKGHCWGECGNCNPSHPGGGRTGIVGILHPPGRLGTPGNQSAHPVRSTAVIAVHGGTNAPGGGYTEPTVIHKFGRHSGAGRH